MWLLSRADRVFQLTCASFVFGLAFTLSGKHWAFLVRAREVSVGGWVMRTQNRCGANHFVRSEAVRTAFGVFGGKEGANTGGLGFEAKDQQATRSVFISYKEGIPAGVCAKNTHVY